MHSSSAPFKDTVPYFGSLVQLQKSWPAWPSVDLKTRSNAGSIYRAPPWQAEAGSRFPPGECRAHQPAQQSQAAAQSHKQLCYNAQELRGMATAVILPGRGAWAPEPRLSHGQRHAPPIHRAAHTSCSASCGRIRALTW
jgi:hypothetical protein